MSAPLAHPSALDRRAAARRPTWRGAGARVAPCYCRKMTAGTTAAAFGLPKIPTARRRSLSLSGGASELSLSVVRDGHHLGRSVRCRGRGSGNKKGDPLGRPRVFRFSAAVRLTHRPPDEGVLVVRQAVEAAERHDGRDDGHANRHAQTGAIRNRRGECRAQAQGRDVGVETHEVVLVASLREYKPVSGRAQAFHGEFSVCVTSLRSR